MRRRKTRTENAFIFIGEKHENEQIEVKEAVTIYDALNLSRFSNTLSNSNRYQFIQLPQGNRISLSFQNDTHLHKIQLEIHNQTLQIISQDPALSYESAYKLLANFLVKQDDKFLFLVNSKDVKIRNRKKKILLSRQHEKDLQQS